MPTHFLKSVRLSPNGQHFSASYSTTRIATMNGMGRVSRYVVNRLSGLTGVGNLQYLTALPWADMLDPKGNYLLKKTRAWCLLCFKEARETGSPFFDPLYTSFRVASVCVQHMTLLRDKCPKCGSAQPFVSRLPFLEYCHKCGHFLGEPENCHNLERQSRRRADVWFTIAAADLVKATIFYQETVTPDMFTGKLGRILMAHAGGKHSVLSRQLGLPLDHLRNWLIRGFKPGFPLFLDLCRRLNCPPSSFLFESDELTHPDLWIREKSKVYAHRRPRGEREIKLLGALLQTISESQSDRPKSVKRIAKELGCSPTYLAKHFPNEIAKIQSRFKAYKNMEHQQRTTKREERIRNAFKTALSRSISTSERSLKHHKLVAPGDTREPEFKAIKREFMGDMR